MTTVALVDDHSLLRNSLATVINSFEDYQVIFEADNGKDCIHQLNPKKLPEILLLDINMPEMNGYETAEWMKKNHPSVKILVLSMMDNDAAIIRMLKSGAKGYILKDSKPRHLKQVLDEIRDKGFHYNELVSSKLVHYVANEDKQKQLSDTAYIQLSDRETDFLKLSCTEKTYKEIADEMCVSARTVEGYRNDLFEKLGVTSRVGLVMYAIKTGLVQV
ncbi:MAG: response regulator transcription factor [Bacteroidota bacterium]|nr:response regulator transcription factor [Bacteroidota bacterium]